MSKIDTKATEPFVKERLALLIEQELRYQLDKIIPKMQTLAKDFEIGLKKDKDGKIARDKQGKIIKDKAERSPLRNLLVTATDRMASLESIKNYISYQASRSEDAGAILKSSYEGEGKDPYEGDRFGKALIKALDGLKENAKEVLTDIAGNLTDNDPLKQHLTLEVKSREIVDLHLKLVQLYLGYLVREHTALRGSQSNHSKSESTQQTTPDPTARPNPPTTKNDRSKPRQNRQ